MSAWEWLSKESRAGKYFISFANSQQAFLSLEDFYFKSYYKKSFCPNCAVLGLFITYSHTYDGQNANTADSADII